MYRKCIVFLLSGPVCRRKASPPCGKPGFYGRRVMFQKHQARINTYKYGRTALLKSTAFRTLKQGRLPSMESPANQKEELRQQLRQAALEYHEFPTPGKISVTPTKQLTNQRDLALAYSPGVAAACEEIVVDAANAFKYTARGNLVAVITNGTAVLGLGNIGPLASKPVMEGKGVLFKKFAGIDVFDIEVNETDPDKLCDIIAAL